MQKNSKHENCWRFKRTFRNKVIQCYAIWISYNNFSFMKPYNFYCFVKPYDNVSFMIMLSLQNLVIILAFWNHKIILSLLNLTILSSLWNLMIILSLRNLMMILSLQNLPRWAERLGSFSHTSSLNTACKSFVVRSSFNDYKTMKQYYMNY